MAAWNRAPALNFQEQERTVIRDFWTALKQFAGRLPFVEDLVAAYYCALDPRPLCEYAASCSQRLPTSSFDGGIDRCHGSGVALHLPMTQLCSRPYSGSPHTSSLSIVRQQRECSAGT